MHCRPKFAKTRLNDDTSPTSKLQHGQKATGDADMALPMTTQGLELFPRCAKTNRSI